MILEGKNL